MVQFTEIMSSSRQTPKQRSRNEWRHRQKTHEGKGVEEKDCTIPENSLIPGPSQTLLLNSAVHSPRHALREFASFSAIYRSVKTDETVFKIVRGKKNQAVREADEVYVTLKFTSYRW